jgi:hypothetical protein
MRKGLRIGAAEANVKVLHTLSGVGIVCRGGDSDRVIAIIALGADS